MVQHSANEGVRADDVEGRFRFELKDVAQPCLNTYAQLFGVPSIQSKRRWANIDKRNLGRDACRPRAGGHAREHAVVGSGRNQDPLMSSLGKKSRQLRRKKIIISSDGADLAD